MELYPRELTQDFWVLGDPYTNVYAAKGRTASALLEAGISANVDNVIRQLEGLATAPDYIVVLHPHADHVTGLPGLCTRFPDAAVIAGEGAREFLGHPRAAAAAVAEDRHLWEFYGGVGLTPPRPPLAEPPSLDGCRIAADGEEIDLGSSTLRLLVVDGHAPGQLAVHLPEARALVVSDALGFHFPGRGFLPVFFTSFAGHLATLDRLEGLRAEILCPAHMGPLLGDDAVNAFHEAREAAHRLAARVRANRHRLEAFSEELFREVYVDEFRMYTEANIRSCVQLLIRRSLGGASHGDGPARQP